MRTGIQHPGRGRGEILTREPPYRRRSGPAAPQGPDVPTLRRRLYAAWLAPGPRSALGRRLDQGLALLIIANLVALLLEQVPAVIDRWRVGFQAFDELSIAAFSVEYALRLWLAPEQPRLALAPFPRLRYMASWQALVDLAAIAPFYAGLLMPSPLDLRLLRVLRLLRLFKLFRVFGPALAQFRALNRGRSLRQQVHALVTPGPFGGRLHAMFDLFIMVWVMISVVAVVIESVDSVYSALAVEFAVLDALAVGIFSAEYLMRLYSCVEDPRFQRRWTGRGRFALRPAALIDLLAILPFFVETLFNHLVDLRFLRIFRLLRLMKLTRYTGATQTLLAAMERERPVIAASAFIMMLLVVLAASLGYLFEHEAQPDKFENIPQAIYWSVITLASVGYGDITPITPAGRLITVVLALLGIGIFAVPAAVLSSAFNEQLRFERESLQNELYKMLGDGQISDAEQAVIDREAKRLHLSRSEVSRIVERARRQRHADRQGNGGVPYALVRTHPLVAFEQFRGLVSQLRQVADLADRPALAEQLASQGSALERAVWAQFRARAAAGQGNDGQGGGGKSSSSEASSTGGPSPERAA